MSESPSEVWIIQREYDHEGHSDVVAVTGAENAEILLRELNARDGGLAMEAIPLISDVTSARVETLTLRQEILRGGVLGVFSETRETTWTFVPGFEAVAAVDKSTSKEVLVSGHDHDAVRSRFSEAMVAVHARLTDTIHPA